MNLIFRRPLFDPLPFLCMSAFPLAGFYILPRTVTRLKFVDDDATLLRIRSTALAPNGGRLVPCIIYFYPSRPDAQLHSKLFLSVSQTRFRSTASCPETPQRSSQFSGTATARPMSIS